MKLPQHKQELHERRSFILGFPLSAAQTLYRDWAAAIWSQAGGSARSEERRQVRSADRTESKHQ